MGLFDEFFEGLDEWLGTKEGRMWRAEFDAQEHCWATRPPRWRTRLKAIRMHYRKLRKEAR